MAERASRVSDQTKKKTELLKEIAELRRDLEKLKITRAETDLEERLYRIFESELHAGFYVLQDGKFQFVNEHAAQYWRYQRDELIGMESMKLVHPDDQAMVRENAIKMLKGERTAAYQFRTVGKDGVILWTTETVTSIKYRGKRALLGNSMDITEQVEYRQKLAEMEALEKSLLEAIPHAVIGVRDRCVIFANDGVEKVFGWKPEDLIGLNTRVFYRTNEENKEIATRFYSAIEKSKTVSMEFPCRRKDGRDIYCMLTASRIGGNAKNENIVVTFEDITDRKRIDEAYKTMARSSVAGVYVVKDGRFVYVNRHAAKFAGRSQRELIGIDSITLVHPDDRDAAKRNAQRMLRGESAIPYEYRIVSKDGSIRWIMEAVTLIPYEGDRVVLGNSMDITEIKETRSELEELKALGSSFLEAIPHAVIGLRERHIVFANDGVKTVFGWEPEELIGKTSRMLYRTDRENVAIGKRLYSALRWHPSYRMEFACRRKDGSDIECMVSAARIGKSLKERSIVITYEDITESKHSKNELEKSREQLRNLSAHLEAAREKERTRIARELHDELGQLLTALHMDIVLLQRKVPEGHPFLLEKTEAMTKLVDMVLDTLKRIYMDLRPGMLDHLGLAVAIGWQAGEFEERTGIKCRVTVDPEDMELDPDLSTAVFRIFQETLTNISRHAEATRAYISLKVREDRVELIVRDNGKGITEQQLSKPNSFGLIGIGERVYHWGGKVKISGKKDRGTTVKVDIPIDRKGEA